MIKPEEWISPTDGDRDAVTAEAFCAAKRILDGAGSALVGDIEDDAEQALVSHLLKAMVAIRAIEDFADKSFRAKHPKGAHVHGHYLSRLNILSSALAADVLGIDVPPESSIGVAICIFGQVVSGLRAFGDAELLLAGDRDVDCATTQAAHVQSVFFGTK